MRPAGFGQGQQHLELSASVVVATYNRPDHVRTCLHHLRAQTCRPREIVVVDSSPDGATRRVVETEFPDAVYAGWSQITRCPRALASNFTSPRC